MTALLAAGSKVTDTALKLRLGTRASALARWQANWVATQLQAQGVEVELVPITTRGDTSSQPSLAAVGSPGVFTKELQRALLDGHIDLAVHSLKDLPTDAVPGLVLAAVPEREDVRDVLVSREGRRLAELPPGAIIGTGSLRRRTQLLHARNDLQMRDIRGNVDTRLEKLDAGQYDAIVLALAGLRRLGLERRVSEVLPPEICLPAVGQGALGIEAREDDEVTRTALQTLDHAASHAAVIAERALLAAISGGCLAPVGAWATLAADGRLHLRAVVLSLDGQTRLAAEGYSAESDQAKLGADVAAQLLAFGAAELIDASRRAK